MSIVLSSNKSATQIEAENMVKWYKAQGVEIPGGDDAFIKGVVDSENRAPRTRAGEDSGITTQLRYQETLKTVRSDA